MGGSAEEPDWDLLFETASAQEGYFTTGQAPEAGYSTQLLFNHIRVVRVAWPPLSASRHRNHGRQPIAHVVHDAQKAGVADVGKGGLLGQG